jgi:nucleotide-binding universal stress UspA family protein
MSEQQMIAGSAPPGRASTFGRVVVGVDGTDPGLVACRQAARLAEEGALVEAVTVVNLAEAVLVGPGAPRMASELREEAETALDQALRVLGEEAERRLLHGVPAPELLQELEATHATLLAIGTHGHRRAAEPGRVFRPRGSLAGS